MLTHSNLQSDLVICVSRLRTPECAVLGNIGVGHLRQVRIKAIPACKDLLTLGTMAKYHQLLCF